MNTGKLKENISNILKNKNTVTILVVFAGIIALYALYNWRVNQATTLVQVPYAKKEINSRNQITQDMVSYMEVPKSLLSNAKNIIQNSYAVIDKYVNYGYTIPQYSFFYTDAILTESKNPESEFADIPKGYTVYSLEVDFDLTYGNSIYPGNYIDLYFKHVDESTDKILFGRLIKGIKVMAVYDGEGNSVFESTSEVRKPKYMWFAVPDELFGLLKKAEYINATIMPIPRNSSYSAEERSPEVDSTYLQNYILAKAINLDNK
jgi:hypothetical protein